MPEQAVEGLAERGALRRLAIRPAAQASPHRFCEWRRLFADEAFDTETKDRLAQLVAQAGEIVMTQAVPARLLDQGRRRPRRSPVVTARGGARPSERSPRACKAGRGSPTTAPGTMPSVQQPLDVLELQHLFCWIQAFTQRVADPGWESRSDAPRRAGCPSASPRFALDGADGDALRWSVPRTLASACFGGAGGGNASMVGLSWTNQVHSARESGLVHIITPDRDRVVCHGQNGISTADASTCSWWSGGRARLRRGPFGRRAGAGLPGLAGASRGSLAG